MEKQRISYPRAVTCAAIGLVFVLLFLWDKDATQGDYFSRGGDFTQVVDLGRDLVAGRDPYAFEASAGRVYYPVTAGIVALWATPLPDLLSSSLFVGWGFSLLACRLLAKGPRWRILILVSCPLVVSAAFAQWAPWIMLAWRLPVLAPFLLLVKPQAALPVVLLRFRKKAMVVAIVLGIGSLVLVPDWPLRFLQASGVYQRLHPVMIWPAGLLLLSTLFLWKFWRARFLLLLSLLPARSIYDFGLLFFIPRRRWQMILLVVLSWAAPFCSKGVAMGQATPALLLFIPCLFFVWDEGLRKRKAAGKADSASSQEL